MTNLRMLKVVRVASLCSGSNVASVQLQNLCEIIGEVAVWDIFDCESDDQKRQTFLKHIDEVLHNRKRTHHSFKNIMEMGDDEAECETHGRSCKIPTGGKVGPLVCTCGFSCKNFSKLFVGTAHVTRDEMLKNMLQEGKGTSGATCHGMIKYLATHAPPFLIWENVPEILDQGNSENLEWLCSALLKLNYACKVAKFNSLNYKIPQRRIRAYGVCVLWGEAGITKEQAHDIAKKIISDAEALATDDPLPLKHFILKPSDPNVKAQLTTLKATKRKALESSADATLVWKKEIKDLCQQSLVAYSSLTTPSHIDRSPWYNHLPQREQHAICYYKTIDPDLTILETSQSITRMTRIGAEKVTLCTLTPNGRIILFPKLVPQLRPLTGFEGMLLQGFPTAVLNSFVNKNEGVSDYDSCFSALAGNAFTGSVVAAVLISVLANLTPGQVAYANGRYREPIKRKSTPDSDIEDLLTRRRVRWVASSSSSAPPP